MKLGGLFSGVGGFELAWTQLGHEVAWMCEWDKNARKVLQARFPGVPIYPDVRDLEPAEVEAVDVLTGGSPCQGFSVAGSRSGLEHSESQLFADYVRIMDGLAERGLQYSVWENVPGVLSITNDDGERTFEHVVAALAGGTVPVRLPTDKRWNTGLAAGRGRAVAWRVLDSRYFGVAQRRRRVFACVAFGDSCEDRAGRTLLAVAEGVRGDSPSGVQAWEGVAGGADAGAGSSRIPELAGTIGGQQRGGQDLDGTTYLPDVPAFGMIGGSGQEGATAEEQPAITASHGQPGNVAQAFNWQSGGDARGLDLTDETSALTCQQTPAVMLHVRGGVEPEWAADETGTIQARGYKGLNHENVRDGQAVVQTYGVRRLTPVECERLQSFPDGWTEPAGSDSARYKAMGNAVTVNVVRWILGRLP
jgi:DNA (cytosine-5)-methyltransferase 1